MQTLKDTLSVIEKAIPRGSKIIYLDYPLHLNVGDLLILKGTEQFFKERNYDVLSRHSDHTSMPFVERTAVIPEDVIIVLHGGGNFGDLYPAHQKLREAVVKKYKDNNVVILPQTVHFQDKKHLIKSGEIFRKHRKLTIFCRDISSRQILEEHFCDNVFLCPDMAQSLWNILPQQKNSDIKSNTLWLIRNDIEKTDLSFLGSTNEPDRFVDWDDICTNGDRRFMKVIRRLEKLNTLILMNILPTTPLWYWYTDKLVDRISTLFMSYESVVTSRMHGHILCCLLKMHTQLIDNAYGKNSGYFESWTGDVPNCEQIKI